MADLPREVVQALRLQAKQWRYSAMLVVTLAICIGANTAVFTVVNSVLLRPLPVPRADDLVLLSNQYPKAGVVNGEYSAAGDYVDRRRELTALDAQGMFRPNPQTILTGGVPERIEGMAVTPSLLRMLAVAPSQGRLFEEKEGERGSDDKIVLSHALWQRFYGGAPSAIGSQLRLGGRPFTVVGVMPRGFLFVDASARFWTPLAFTAEQKESYHNNNWYHVGRLKPGTALGLVQQQVNRLNSANLERFPKWRDAVVNAGFFTKVSPLKDLLVADVRSTLYLLWAGAAFILLIGIVNIASLVLARSSARTREIGTRLALGASISRVGKQLLIENAAVALLGGLAGLVLAAGILHALSLIGLENFPRVDEVRIDGTIVAWTLCVALAGAILFAALQLGFVYRFNLTQALRDGSRTASSGRRSRFLRQTLIIVQVGFAFVLLTGAGLLLASFRAVLNVDPGFRLSGVLTASTVAPNSQYGNDPALRSLMDRSLAAIRSLPGVLAAGATDNIPFSGNHNGSVVLAEGYVMKPGESVVAPWLVTVTPGYFETMGMQLARGRYFDERDNATGMRTAIVDERLAQKFWRGKDAIGRRIYRPNSPDILKTDEKTEWLTVVGVVRSVRLDNLAAAANPAGMTYFPYAQNPQRGYTFALRSVGDASALAQPLRKALAGVDPALAQFDIQTMSDRTALSVSSRRAAMSLAVSFGCVALFLSAVGIYGMLAYLVTQRRREIGIRMAVGSSQSQIFALFFREGLLLTNIGLAAGIAGTVAVRGFLEQQVYGIKPLNLGVLGGVIALLGVVALTACVWPARRASRVDPLIVLSEQ